ncbi:unnamed protein product [Cylindrotheca closterium]|uniref:FAD/NAD(P)-binding domain-containing protein n=1 Tax=Cylindrotheca closterium TaxID=2856 RepID=A0AAD2GD26_9STRA|nr:unnamed protein product [Cylindrotheca closterium]
MRLSHLIAISYIALAEGFLSKISQQIPSGGLTDFALHGTATTTNINTCDVAIFGGGFGGLYSALSLSREAQKKGKKLDIAIVDPSTQFVFLPLLYDLTVGTATSAEVCPTYKDILKGTGVRHIQASLDCFTSDDFQSATLFLCNHNNEISNNSTKLELSFRSSILAVGSSPESTLASVPGATENVQPFYTQKDAKETSRILEDLEDQAIGSMPKTSPPKIAIVGGGYGGVELAACIKRRIPESKVRLLTRGPPMKGTRAEQLVDKALLKLGVEVELSSVQEITKGEEGNDIFVKRKLVNAGDDDNDEENDKISKEPWSVVFWTAGAGPSSPVSGDMDGLLKSDSGRLAVESTLRCISNNQQSSASSSFPKRNSVWALGDCAEILVNKEYAGVVVPATPKTAQAAMQQADIVAQNVLAELTVNSEAASKEFQYQDLGTMLSLGGPNAAVMAPIEESPLAPVFKPLLDTARLGFGFADEAFVNLSKSPLVATLGLSPVVDSIETLGLSLGGYGLGVDSDTSPGTLSGTLTGAARRALYAVRMPTNKQRATAAASAAISTAAALAKEAAQNLEKQQQ